MKFYPNWLPPNWWWQIPRLPKSDEIYQYVKRCQNSDGGFSNSPSSVSYMECCFHAMVTLNLLNRVDQINENSIKKFMIDRLNSDGGFADDPGSYSTVFNTFYGIISLNILRQLSLINTISTVRYLKSKQHREGGFVNDVDSKPDMITTFWVVTSIWVLDAIDQLNLKKLREFIEGCAYPSGGFSSYPGEPPFLEYTYEGLTISYLLGIPLKKEHEDATFNFICQCQTPDKRFSEQLGAPSTMGDTMWAVSSLAILNRLHEIEVNPLLKYLENKQIVDLWSIHCSSAAFSLLVPNAVEIRPRVLDLQLIDIDKSHMISINVIDGKSPAKPPPKFIAIEQSTIDDISNLAQAVEEEVEIIAHSKHKKSTLNLEGLIQKIGDRVRDSFLFNDLIAIFEKQPQSFLNLTISDDLAQIPWELMLIGEECVCLKHAIGKFVVSTMTSNHEEMSSYSQQPRMLIIGNPLRGFWDDGLPEAQDEIFAIKKVVENSKQMDVITLVGKEASRKNLFDLIDDLKHKIDIIHYAGHVYVDTNDPLRAGLELADGKLEARVLAQKLQRSGLKLVFLNGCLSGMMRPKRMRYSDTMYGVSSHFLSMQSTFIGSYWSIFDDCSRKFAEVFYQHICYGFPIGESLRLARNSSRAYGNHIRLAWAFYTLLGNPMTCVTEFTFKPSSVF